MVWPAGQPARQSGARSGLAWASAFPEPGGVQLERVVGRPRLLAPGVVDRAGVDGVEAELVDQGHDPLLGVGVITGHGQRAAPGCPRRIRGARDAGQQWSINFRVDDLDGMVGRLGAAGIAGRVNVLERWESREALEAFRGDGPDDESAARILALHVHDYVVAEA